MKPTNKTIDEHGNIILTCETRWLFGFIKTTHKFIATKESPSGYWNWMRLPNLTNVKYPFVLQLDAWCRNFNMVEGSSLKSTQPTPSVKRTGVLMNAIISLLERKFFPDYNAVKKENVRLKQDIYNLVENKDSLIGLEVYLYYKAKYELKATETYLILCQMDVVGGVFDAAPQGIVVAQSDAELTQAVQQAMQYLMDQGIWTSILASWGVDESAALDTAELNPKV